jgi:cell division septation protein DedD
MRGVFDEDERKTAKAWRDTELTLGPGLLLGIFFALVVLCGLFFGVGYAVGHRGSQEAVATAPPAANPQAPAQAADAAHKPSATGQDAAAQPSDNPSTDPAADPASPANPDTTAPGTPQTADADPADDGTTHEAAKSVQPPVKTVSLPIATSTPSPQAASEFGGAAKPQSAAASSELMVQVAAVSHLEDARVLVAALHNRGYAVTARRDTPDDLIHVRIGPFSSHDEAEKWRLKLLNDGYNAIVQP